MGNGGNLITESIKNTYLGKRLVQVEIVGNVLRLHFEDENEVVSVLSLTPGVQVTGDGTSASATAKLNIETRG